MVVDMKPTLLILAAGMGSRYGGLKQMDPVGPDGEVILDYSVFDARRAGFGKVVFVIRRDIEAAFRDQVGSRFEEKISVDYVFQELEDLPEGFAVPPERTKPWGTVHAMLAARDVIQEPFGVINADDYYGQGAFQLLADALRDQDPSGLDLVLIGYPLKNTVSTHGTVSRGMCEVKEGQLVSVTECHEIQPVEGGIEVHRNGTPEVVDGSQLVSMNTWGFTPAVFQEARQGFSDFLRANSDPVKGEYYIPTLVQQIMDAGKGTVEVLPADDAWLGVTYPEDKARVQAGLQALADQGVYPRPLWGEG
jgi:NDP-sugar pyrophosphorylase family protein